MESSYQSLVSVIVGLILGSLIAFLSSIGLEFYKDYHHKRELEKRILEELEIIREEVKTTINSESFLNNSYRTNSFNGLRQELILKLNGRNYRAIVETYEKIMN